MIDLSLYPKFQQDVEQSHVTIYPLVIIDNTYYFSTIKESFFDVAPTEEPRTLLNFKDYNLSISNIKESVNIKDRKFKISNVTLSLSNYKIEQDRFSDMLSGSINKEVEIYFKTQSCQYLSDCLMIYKGSLREIKHDDSKINITLEDLTQSRFHKDVPIANVGFSDNAYNKDYFNRYIPITYGFVEKAPAIPYIDKNEPNNIFIISDDISDVTGSGRDLEMAGFGIDNSIDFNELVQEGIHPLHIYKGDYYRVLENYDTEKAPDIDELFTTYSQYSVDESNNFIKIEKIIATNQVPENPPSMNLLQTIKVRFPNSFELLQPNSLDDDGVIYDSNDFTLYHLDATIYGAENSLQNPLYTTPQNISNPFVNYSEIPYSQLTESDSEVDVFLASNFRPSSDRHGMYTRGIHYPSHTGYANGTHFGWLINAWTQVNAHDLAVTFIDMPSIDSLQHYLGNKLIEDGLGGEGATGTNIMLDQTTVLPQSNISNNQQASWAEDAGFTGNELTQDGETTYGDNNFNYFEYEVYDSETEETSFHQETLKSLFDGTHGDGNTTFPQNMWLFRLNDEQVVGGYKYCMVGMKNDSMNTNQALTVYNNPDNPLIFYNMFNDGSDTPYLFENPYNEDGTFNEDFKFAAFNPIGLTDKTNYSAQATYNRNIRVWYEAEWNGRSIGENHVYNGEGSLVDDQMLYWGWYPGSNLGTGIETGGYGTVRQQYISRYMMDDGAYNYGGSGWMMYITEDITNPLSSSYPDAGSLDEYTNDNVQCTIKANSILPCQGSARSKMNFDQSSLSGEYFHFESYSLVDPNYFKISSMNPGADITEPETETRLTAVFTIPDLDISDELDYTQTYAFGKIKCEFPGGDYFANTGGTNTKFLLEIAPVGIEEAGDLSFFEVNGHAVIDIAGGSGSIIQDGGESLWSVDSADAPNPDDPGNNINTFSDTGIANLSDTWGTANAYQGITAAYRMTSGSNTQFLNLKTHIYSMGVTQFILFENALDSEFYLDSQGRADIAAGNVFQYTGGTGEGKNPIENPADIIYHFIEKELGYENIINEDSLLDARNNHIGFRLGFSVKDKINSKKLVEEIAKNSFLFPKFTVDGNFGFDTIKDIYNEVDVDVTFKEKDIIDISFSRTPIQNINTLVNVKYKKDYAEDEHTKQTGYCDAYDFFGNGDGYFEGFVFDEAFEASDGRANGYSYSYYNLEREDKILEFESDYIRDKGTAVKLRDFLMFQNANQHNIVNLTTTLKHINLETGDIIKFNTLIGDLKCYGEDYTSNGVYRNGQEIYPYFKITDISKTKKNIKIKAIQLHRLTSTFTPLSGSLTRMVDFTEGSGNWNWEDANILNNFIEDRVSYMTTEQIRVANIIPGSGDVVDNADLSALLSYLGYTSAEQNTEDDTQETQDNLYHEGEMGDINTDDFVNVVDVVLMVNFILGGNTTEQMMELGDLNGDGVVDVSDIVILVGMILEG